ncbi:hypothetical protein OHB02_12000 [Streptomyces albidoflavus]|nr:hypothetical protein OHB02_12000 [Streptomyces albidoflavus]
MVPAAGGRAARGRHGRDPATAAVRSSRCGRRPAPAQAGRGHRLGADGRSGLLALAGAGAALWAYVEDQPVGYAGLLLGLASAITVWVLGHRQGVRERRGRQAALRHLADVQAARAAGAAVPELSPQLRRLLEQDGGTDA